MFAIRAILPLTNYKSTPNICNTLQQTRPICHPNKRHIPITKVVEDSLKANDMSIKSISPSIIDSWHYAALASNISAFLTHHLCENTLITTVVPPVAAMLPHLAIRLNAYGWQVTTGSTPGLVYNMNATTTLDVWTAVKAMEEMAVFLGQWANVLKAHPFELSYANEESLQSDLNKVAAFIKKVVHQLPEAWETSHSVEAVELSARRSSLRGGGDPDELAGQSNEVPADKEAERQHEAVEALNNTSSPPKWTVSMQTSPTAIEEVPTPEIQENKVLGPTALLQPERHLGDSDVSTLILEPRPTQNIPAINFLLPPNRRDLPTPPPPSNTLPPPSVVLGESSWCYTPYDLRPHEVNARHPPHLLDGSRHTSRCDIVGDEDFAQHCLKYGPWLIDRPLDPYTTIQLGHGVGASFRCFEASFLGFPGIDTIKIVNPLCAVELRGLDWDVLRAVAVHLRQYVGQRSVSLSNTNADVQQAEKASFGLVDREVESRRAEKSSETDVSETYAASGLSTNGRPSFPLRHDNRPYRDVPLKMPTPPTRTERPEFNTRRNERRTMRISEMEARDLSEDTTETKLVQSLPEGDSPRGTATHAAYDSRGEYRGQSAVCEQDERTLRSSRDRPRIDVQDGAELGVNYGCTGRSRARL